MSRFATILMILVAVTMMATPSFADLNHMDIGGSLDMYYFWSQNTYDFDDDGIAYYDYYDKANGGEFYYYGTEDDQDDFLRMDVRLWFEADLLDDVMVHIGLRADRDFNSVIDEPQWEVGKNTLSLDVWVEEAYIQFSQIWDSIVTVTMGRKYFNRGDDPNSEELYNAYWGYGFILSDAQSFSPANLSYIGTIERDPFDLVVATLDFEDWMLDIGFVKAAETRWTDEDWDGYFAYLSYIGMDQAQIDFYFLLTMTDGDMYLGADDARVDQYTVGARVAGELTETLTGKAEVAYNFGDISGVDNIGYPFNISGSHDDGDISGFAVQLGIHWAPDADYNPGIGAMVTYLDGDEDMGQDEDFNGFVSVWEGKMYGEIADPYIKTNMWIVNVFGGFDLNEDLRLSTSVYWFHMVDADSATLMPGQVGYLTGSYVDDEAFGWEWDVYLDYQFSEEVAAQLAAGVFFPGDTIESAGGYNSALDEVVGSYGESDEAIFFRGSVKVGF